LGIFLHHYAPLGGDVSPVGNHGHPYVGSVSTILLPDRFKLPPKLPSGPAEGCPLDAL